MDDDHEKLYNASTWTQTPIDSAYLVTEAGFVGVHHFGAFERYDLLGVAAPGATLLINSPYGPEGTWDRLPSEAQQAIIDKELEVWVVDGGSRDATVATASAFPGVRVLGPPDGLGTREAALPGALAPGIMPQRGARRNAAGPCVGLSALP